MLILFYVKPTQTAFLTNAILPTALYRSFFFLLWPQIRLVALYQFSIFYTFFIGGKFYWHMPCSALLVLQDCLGGEFVQSFPSDYCTAVRGQRYLF